MAFVDQSYKKKNEDNSSTPLGVSGENNPPQPPAGQPDPNVSAPTTSSGGMGSGQQAAPAAKTANKKATAASSGMFNNIQNYVNKNKPQAQKMSGAVSQDFTKQAAEIRKVAEEKQNVQTSASQANQAAMTKAKGQASAAVDNIMGTQTTSPEYQAATSDQFEKMMEGQIAGTQEISNLDLAQQRAKAQEMGQLAKNAQTEQGRRDLLGRSFQKQGQYTRGMSGLDSLITTGDQAARDDLIKGTQGTASNLAGNISTISQQGSDQKRLQDLLMNNIGGEIKGYATGAQSRINRDVDSEIEALKTKLYGENGDLSNLQNLASSKFSEGLKYKTADDFYKSLLNQNVEWNKGGDRATAINHSINRLLGSDASIADVWRSRKVGGGWNRGAGHYDKILAENLILDRGKHNSLQNRMQELLSSASDYGIDTSEYGNEFAQLGRASKYGDNFGFSGMQNQDSGDVYSYDMEKFKDITSRLYDQINSTRESALASQLDNKYKDLGVSGEDFASGDFLDRAGVSTQEQRDRMAALQSLMGREDLNTLNIGQGGSDMDFIKKIKEDYGI